MYVCIATSRHQPTSTILSPLAWGLGYTGWKHERKKQQQQTAGFFTKKNICVNNLYSLLIVASVCNNPLILLHYTHIYLDHPINYYCLRTFCLHFPPPRRSSDAKSIYLLTFIRYVVYIFCSSHQLFSYLRTFSSSFSLSRRGSDSVSLSRAEALLPPPQPSFLFR